jgi:hypothetical protein
MGQLANFPNPLPIAAAGRFAGLLLGKHSPSEIAAAVDILMDLLDIIEGDPDTENDDPAEADDFGEEDDHSGQMDEDECNTGSGEHWEQGTHYGGAGCPISDPGGLDRGEPAFAD